MTYQTVTIHLGMHKTGSSAIQSMLRRNAARLARASIHYPEYKGRKLADRMDGNHSLVFLQHAGIEDLGAFLESRITLLSQHKSLIVSAEYLSRTVAIRGVLRSLVSLFPGAAVRFVIYIRRYDHQLESAYAEGVKRKLCGDLIADERSYDLTSILSPLFDMIGKENVVVRPYNPRHWVKGDLLSDFLQAVGVPAGTVPAKALQGDVARNTRRPRLYTYILSRLTKVEDKIAMAAFLDDHPQLMPADRAKYFLSPEERNAVNARQREVDQPFFDAQGLGDLEQLLGFSANETDPDWTPFEPTEQPIDRILFEFLNSRAA